MTIFKGEIYWIDVGKPQGSEPVSLVNTGEGVAVNGLPT
jgi:hypothetical protein